MPAICLRGSRELSISEKITVSIPNTCDPGDALLAAVQIVAGAHTAWACERGSDFTVGCFIASIRQKLSERHLRYLKTGEVA
jgi:hypothetical protein